MSSRPHPATARSTIAAACASSDTSQTTVVALWPAEARASVAARSASSLRSASTRDAPASAKALAVASPMPELAPVTRATWPVKSYVGFMICLPFVHAASVELSSPRRYHRLTAHLKSRKRAAQQLAGQDCMDL